MSFGYMLRAAGGYYALPIALILFGDAAWWGRRRAGGASNFALLALVAPPLAIIALGARWAPGAGLGPSFHELTLLAIAVLELAAVALIFRRRQLWWPRVTMLLGFMVAWTLVALFVISVLISGDSL